MIIKLSLAILQDIMFSAFKETDITRATGEIRAARLTNPHATDNLLGIFTLSRECPKAYKPLVASFMVGTLDSLLSLERGMIRCVGATTALLGNEDFGLLLRLSKQSNGLIALTTFFSHILYYSDNSAKQAKSRYGLSSNVHLYLPDIPAKHDLEIWPPHSYDFSVPATINIVIGDKVRMQSLIIQFSPIRYSFFKNHEELAGVSPPEGKEILHERARDLRRGANIYEIARAAQATEAIPGFSLSLVENNQVTCRVQGDLTTERRAGFTVYASDFPDRFVFQPLAVRNGSSNSQTIHMQPLVEGFLRLQLRRH